MKGQQKTAGLGAVFQYPNCESRRFGQEAYPKLEAVSSLRVQACSQMEKTDSGDFPSQRAEFPSQTRFITVDWKGDLLRIEVECEFVPSQ
jgi:hypothetical protein